MCRAGGLDSWRADSIDDVTAEGQVMTFEALIARAKRDNPKYSATQWADYDRCIARAQKRVAIKQKQERHIVLPHRTFRVALAGALVLLLVFLL